MADAATPTLRLDKWHWFARFFKTRSLAAKVISEGHVRVNGERTTKPARGIGVGDVLTFVQGRDVRVVRVLETGTRRGPASEAQQLYEDLTPRSDMPANHRAGARPTKRVRRHLDAIRALNDPRD